MLLLQNAVDELYTYMKQFVDSTEAEVLWRLARAICDKAESTADKAVRKELIYDAFRTAELALKLGDTNFACHKVLSLSKIINTVTRTIDRWPLYRSTYVRRYLKLITGELCSFSFTVDGNQHIELQRKGWCFSLRC